MRKRRRPRRGRRGAGGGRGARRPARPPRGRQRGGGRRGPGASCMSRSFEGHPYLFRGEGLAGCFQRGARLKVFCSLMSKVNPSCAPTEVARGGKTTTS